MTVAPHFREYNPNKTDSTKVIKATDEISPLTASRVLYISLYLHYALAYYAFNDVVEKQSPDWLRRTALKRLHQSLTRVCLHGNLSVPAGLLRSRGSVVRTLERLIVKCVSINITN